MKTLEFIVQMTDKLIWPLTTGILIFLSRKQLKDLIHYIKKAKISEFEIEFDRDLAKVKTTAEGEFETTSPDWKVSLFNLAQNIPNTAILESWKEIDKKVETLIHLVDPKVDLDQPTHFKLMQNIVTNQQIIETKKAKIYNDLRQIRNKVAHVSDYTVTSEQAMNYVSIAVQFIEYIDSRIAAEKNKGG
jgi:hypothetical protein